MARRLTPGRRRLCGDAEQRADCRLHALKGRQDHLDRALGEGLTGSGPIPEGVVVPVDPVAAIAAGSYRKVPVLASNTADEGQTVCTVPGTFTGIGRQARLHHERCQSFSG